MKPHADAVWAEEGGIQFSVEMRNGLVVCRILETSNGIDFKEIAVASVTYARWDRIRRATAFQAAPTPAPPHNSAESKSIGWGRGMFIAGAAAGVTPYKKKKP